MSKKQIIPGFDMETFQAQLVSDIKSGKPLMGQEGVLTPLIKQCLEAALEGEMNSHMATCLEDPENENRRNGKSSKVVRGPTGAFELEVPRDRESSFEPQLVKKRQTTLTASLDNKILALYGLGMSYQDIASHVQELYGIETSPATISAITDKLIPVLMEWRI